MTRSRRRTGSNTLLTLAVVATVMLVVGGSLGTAAFTTGSVGRTSDIGVASDVSGLYGIDTAPAVHTNTTEPLVDLTNRFGQDVTVTVTLRSDSTDTGDLVVDGTSTGDQATFTLGQGETRQIDLAVHNDSALGGRTVYFHIEASAPGLYVSAQDRTVPIES